jgi:hypothetical protein
MSGSDGEKRKVVKDWATASRQSAKTLQLPVIDGGV